jgi:hypothetical protein
VSRSLSVGVSAGESVGDGVGGFRLVFHPEIEAVKLACPLMLRDRREPLVKQELQADLCVRGRDAPTGMGASGALPKPSP